MKKRLAMILMTSLLSVSLIHSPLKSYAEDTEIEYSRQKVEKESSYWYEQSFEPVTMQVTCRTRIVSRNVPTEAGEAVRSIPSGTALKIVATAYGYDGTDSVFYKTAGDRPEYIRVQYLKSIEEKTVSLPVENIMQKPELPNGCEVTSLAIILNYAGIEVDKCELSDKYLPKSSTLNADPNEYYLREPRSNGFYCFAKPLITCTEAYAEKNSLSITTEDLTGKDVSALYKTLDEGHPVVVWGTLIWANPGKYDSGLYYNLHCLVLSGYTDKTVTIQDPLNGETTISRFKFEEVWYKMGQRAMTAY